MTDRAIPFQEQDQTMKNFGHIVHEKTGKGIHKNIWRWQKGWIKPLFNYSGVELFME
jgi:hypothetical protein